MELPNDYELSFAAEEQQCEEDEEEERKSYDECDDNSNDALIGNEDTARSTGAREEGAFYRSISAYSSSDESDGMFDDLESAINSR